MRISDWSSDVCSSDLQRLQINPVGGQGGAQGIDCQMWADLVAELEQIGECFLHAIDRHVDALDQMLFDAVDEGAATKARNAQGRRSEERRVGKECVSTGRSRGSPCNKKKKKTTEKK